MNLTQMHNEVQMILSAKGNVKCGEFKSALFSVIRRINAEVEKPNEMAHLVYEGDGTLIAEIEDETIAEERELIGGGDIYSAMSIDGVNNCITVPADWVKILAVFRGGVELNPVPYDILKTNKDERDFTSINRSLYFNFDVTATTLDLWLRIRRNYLLPAIADTEYTGMPETAYQLLLTGAVLALLSRPQYYDYNLVASYRYDYEALKREFSTENITRPAPDSRAPAFTFNP